MSQLEVWDFLLSKGLPPTEAWLDEFLRAQRPSTPLPALKQTALFRILATDITTSLLKSELNVFPTDIANVEVVQRVMKGPMVVQILDVEDVGSSKWSQLEAIEAAERGETTKGREIIRVVSSDDNQPDQAPQPSPGPFKLLLQDVQGSQAWAFISQRDFVVARGVLLLEPPSMLALGGKIEALHQAWKDRRKAFLKSELGISE